MHVGRISDPQRTPCAGLSWRASPARAALPSWRGQVLPPSLPPPLCAAFTSFVAFPQVSMAGSSFDPMAVDSTAEENLLDKLVRGPSARAQ